MGPSNRPGAARAVKGVHGWMKEPDFLCLLACRLTRRQPHQELFFHFTAISAALPLSDSDLFVCFCQREAVHGYSRCFLSLSTLEIKVNMRPDCVLQIKSLSCSIETGNLNHLDNLKGVKFELISKLSWVKIMIKVIRHEGKMSSYNLDNTSCQFHS